MSRPYTGTKDGVAKRRRPGTELFYKGCPELMDGKLTGLGTFVIRHKRGKAELSVHSTARAMNFGYTSRKAAVRFINAVIAAEAACQLEALFDYYPAPYGRGWVCTRMSWKKYTKREINPAGAQLIHLELSPAVADSPELASKALQAIRAELEKPAS